MTTCLRCYRPLKHPTESGLGPVCARAVETVQEVECDLFGYDIDAAALAAQARVTEFIELKAAESRWLIKMAFRGARIRLGVGP